MELKVDRMAFGGDGLARRPAGAADEGKVVFVRGALASETVLAEITDRRKDFDRAQTVRVIEAATDRTRPACRLFGRCGGCQLMHLQYPSQAALKHNWLIEHLSRAGVPETAIDSVQHSPGKLSYRLRARLAVDKRGKVGFQAASSRSVVGLTECPILTKEVNQRLTRLAAFFDYQPPSQRLNLHLGADREGSAFVIVSPDSPKGWAKKTADLMNRLKDQEDKLEATVYLDRPDQVGDQAPAGSLAWPIGSERLTLFPGVFSQAQIPQNKALVRNILELAGPVKDQSVLDLMAGMGNISIPLARAGATVTAVEIDPVASANGRFNAARAGLDLEWLARPAEEALTELLRQGRSYDLIVADPPRTGLKGMIEALVGLASETIVYVSCQPAALARDLAQLAEAGYRVERVVPVDMFPQTYHLETVVRLRAKAR